MIGLGMVGAANASDEDETKDYGASGEEAEAATAEE